MRLEIQNDTIRLKRVICSDDSKKLKIIIFIQVNLFRELENSGINPRPVI